MIDVDANSSPPNEYNYDGLAASLAVLQTFLAVLAIGIAIIAFIGFKTIISHIENIAREIASKTAQRTADQEIKDYINRQGGAESDKKVTKTIQIQKGSQTYTIEIPDDTTNAQND